MKAYFKERCYDGTKNTEFWPTIKPFITNKGCKSEVDLMIEDGFSIISEPLAVASSMNDSFSNVASKIGRDLNPPDFIHLTPSEFVKRSIEYFNSSSHESISEIENNLLECSFKFHPIDVGVMAKTLGALDHRKATCCDRIPATVLSQSRLVISQPLTYIFNSCIFYNSFPDLCKLAEIRTIYKKSNPLDKKNYRLVSRPNLTSLSKLFEKLLESQLVSFQNKILHPGISAFRSGYSCQSVLLKLIEDILSDIHADWFSWTSPRHSIVSTIICLLANFMPMVCLSHH